MTQNAFRQAPPAQPDLLDRLTIKYDGPPSPSVYFNGGSNTSNAWIVISLSPS